MPIETVEDILEDLANKLGIYGAHDEEKDPVPCNCRVCWTSNMHERLDQAFWLERALSQARDMRL